MACKDHLTFICLFIGVVMYVMLGAIIFHFMEHPREKEDAQAAYAILVDFLANHTCVNTSELATFLDGIKYLTDTGMEIGSEPEPSMWSFSSSVTFALTVVTTIGYGVQTPSSRTGQAICVCYAMFGIPLCLVLLSKIGDGMAAINNGLVDKLVKWPKDDKKRTILTIGLLFIVGFILLVLIPCIGFSYQGGWTYATSMYFTMVTLSTVGFGDYVLAEKGTGVGIFFYRAFICVWIFVGLAWLASIISTFYELMNKNVNKVMSMGESKTEEKQAIDPEKEGGTSDQIPVPVAGD